jgi:arsenate reductase
VKILFLCVANSVRSQMAEGMARHLFGDAADVESAGVVETRVHPHAIAVMREAGIDITGQWSKTVNELRAARIDVIITLSADEVCPIVPDHVERLHWPLPEPTSGSPDQALARVRAVRDEIEQRLRAFGRERGLL